MDIYSFPKAGGLVRNNESGVELNAEGQVTAHSRETLNVSISMFTTLHKNSKI